ncbi:hypothetical protein [Moellerella wisconsensis]|uniref:Lipoprotein n=1 Tax=Moellerella wisconsensis ATCC 35017 TaxID=1354267 RepID=A0A0N0IBA1_9GAMM|nr:hypothetical protein [Moellerella wisconsensis]KPD03630.1 hypothetical protein M992_0920 [Moellerella wisconsensis ATCC 35017]VFS50558.1 Uncharacterised protein [Moellerella wisconsensis]
MKFPCPKSALTSLFSLFFLSGCAQSEVFSPPVSGENLHFSATVPSELEALPISAMYRSEICRKARRTANMESNSVPGFHRATYTLLTGQLNQVKANIPKYGGGKCDWKLSNITFEVKLKDPSKIDPLITENFGAEATFVLDNNAPATFDGGFEKKTGDINETLILFPLLVKDFMNGNIFKSYLIGKSDPLTYKINMSQRIHLNVIYKKQELSVWTGRKNENRPFMTYPNGDIVYGEVRPEYKKLIEISESSNIK